MVNSITKKRSLYGLASFYIHFVRYFSTLATPFTKIVISFHLDIEQDNAFNVMMDRLCSVSILALHSKNFEIECDALKIRIKAVLIHNRRPIAFSMRRSARHF